MLVYFFNSMKLHFFPWVLSISFYKTHPISGQVSCLLWIFCRKLTMLQRELTAVRSDPMGVLTQGTATTDKVFFWCTRCVLNIKSTTSNMIVVGKIGHIPLSISCHITVICYSNMLHNLPQDMIVNTLRPEQNGCHFCRFTYLKAFSWMKICEC